MVPLVFPEPRPNHESGPPGLQTGVPGLVVARQQPLCEQEEAQGAVRREHQAEAWRVSQRQNSRMVLCCKFGAASAVAFLISEIFVARTWKGRFR